MRSLNPVAVFVFGVWATICGAQSYPVKPIELVSPTGAGGGSDLVARTVADIIAREKLLPQPIVVQNKPGGGGAMGQTYVAAKKGDPYTILLAGTTLITVPLRTGLEVGLDKFQPLGMIGVDLNSLAVSEDSPYQARSRISWRRRRRIRRRSTSGSRSPAAARTAWSTGWSSSRARSSIRCRSRAAPTRSTAVLGGHVHATAENLGEVMPHVEGEKLRLLGVPAMKRPAGLPECSDAEGAGLRRSRRRLPLVCRAGGRIRATS